MTSELAPDLVTAFDGVLADLLSRERLLESARADTAIDSGTRRRIFELGWPAICLEEDQGGLSLGRVELAGLAAVAGARLVPSAMRDEAFLLAPALGAAVAGGDSTAGSLLERLLSAEAAGGGRAVATLSVEEEGDAHVVHCDGVVAWLSPRAEAIALVSPDGAVLLFTDDPGLKVTAVEALDRGQGAAALHGHVRVPASRVWGADVAGSWWENWRLAAMAEVLGCASAVLDLSVEHASAREQFGRALSQFQAVSHLLAEMKQRTELVRSGVSLLAASEDRSLGASLAYAVPQMGREVIERAVQVHGGTGFTWEYGLHLYYRRVLQIQAGVGGAAATAAAVGRALLEGP